MTSRSSLRRWAVSAAALVTVAALSACGGGGAAPASGGGSTEPQAGGDLVHLVSSFPDSWQLQDTNNWYSSQVITGVVDNLVFSDADAEVTPWLAESWTLDDAQTTYTFTLRDGVTFSDGSELDAQLVADNLDVLAHGDEAKGIVPVVGFPTQYDGAEAPDPRTVVVRLTAPNNGFLRALAHHSTGIVGRATLEASREEQSDLRNLVGSGPFVVDSYEAGKEVRLANRDDYDWAPEGAAHTGAAYLDSITYRVVPEPGVRVGALESGQADSLHFVPTAEETRLEDQGFQILHSDYLGGSLGWTIRLTGGLVDDKSVRLAIQHGIDRQEIVDTLYNDKWRVATSPFQETVPGWADVSDLFAYDQDLSNQLLDEAGWTERDDDGIRTKDGERLSFPFRPSPLVNGSTEEIQLIAQQLEEIGIGLEIETTDLSNYLATFNNDDIPLLQAHFTATDATFFHDKYSKDGINDVRADDPTLEGYLDALVAAPDDAAKDAAALKVQERLVSEGYYVPIVEAAQVYVAAPDVKGFSFSATGRPSFYDVWLDR